MSWELSNRPQIIALSLNNAHRMIAKAYNHLLLMIVKMVYSSKRSHYTGYHIIQVYGDLADCEKWKFQKHFAFDLLRSCLIIVTIVTSECHVVP